jgi:chemotaxis protein methyltransferase CheR
MTDSELRKFSDFVRNLVGLDFVPKNWPSLKRSLSRASLSRGFETTTEFVKWIRDVSDDATKIDILASLLTIGETFFFRDSKTFEGIERVIIPDLINSRHSDLSPLRIWSAGCSTGEEPYTLAVLFKRLFYHHKQYQFQILGTDVNKESLEKANKGFYKEWSFRGAPHWLKKDFFTQVDGGYQLHSSVTSAVEFRYLNMVSQEYSSALYGFTPLDIILCRNTMMYFTSDVRKKIIDRMLFWLSDEGWLILSPSEVPHVANQKLELVKAPGAVFFRRKKTPTEMFRSSSVETIPSKKNCLIEQKPKQSPAPVTPISTQWDIAARSQVEDSTGSFEKDLELAGKAFSVSDYRKIIELLKDRPEKEANQILSGQRYFMLAKAYANLGILDEAQRSIEVALTIEKLNPSYHYMFASILQAREMKQEAVERLQRVLFLDPDHIMTNVTLGTIQKGLNKRNESLRNMRNAIMLVDRLPSEEIIPDSDGATAVHIKEMILSTISSMT